MSKKETRRAARDAFPKAPAPAPRKGAKYAPRQSGAKYTSKTQKQKARVQTAGQTVKKPSWIRAVIFAAVLAVLYFVMIQYLWVPKDENGNPTSTVWGSLLIAVIGFVVFVFIVYLTDRLTYQRKMRKLQGGSGQSLRK